MNKTLYLMRHGQTLFNVRKKIQGACDSPLTEEGIRQARIAGAYFKTHSITFDRAYSSTQERACDTLELVTDMPYTRLKGLKEWNFGIYEGESEDLNPPLDPIRKSYADFFVQYNGESDTEVAERMNDCLTGVMEEPGHNTVLAVSHGGACYAFLRKWEDTIQRVPNCAILKFEYEDKVFKFIEVIEHDFAAVAK
ncbi:MAG: histidine phosphatase family protein [Bacillus sp. (in: firmicutes)]